MGFDIGAVLGAQVSKLDTTEVTMIPVTKLLTNSNNFYAVELDEDLVDSIRMHGILEPLLVVEAQGERECYRVISGHRRLKALCHMALTPLPDEIVVPKAPCIVLEDDLPPHKEMQLLIEANRQRKKTPWEIGEEARRLTEAYVKAKDAGEDLSGRIRDRVAEAMNENASRLGRLNAIEKNLHVAGFAEKFKTDQLPESVAYAISQLDHEQQYRFLDYSIAAHEPLTEKLVKRFVKERKSKTEEIAEPKAPEHITSHSEREIYDACIELMQGIYEQMLDFMEFCEFDFSKNITDENCPVFRLSEREIVSRLFLWGTTHSGGTSTRQKCKELGLTSDGVWFKPSDDDDDDDLEDVSDD